MSYARNVETGVRFQRSTYNSEITVTTIAVTHGLPLASTADIFSGNTRSKDQAKMPLSATKDHATVLTEYDIAMRTLINMGIAAM